MYNENKIIEINSSEQFKEVAQWCNDNNLFLEEIDANKYITRRTDYYLTNEDIIRILRNRRENECFLIINRGQLWYDTLTQEQIDELKIWYQAWLDVTETREVPTKPSWLEGK